MTIDECLSKIKFSNSTVQCLQCESKTSFSRKTFQCEDKLSHDCIEHSTSIYSQEDLCSWCKDGTDFEGRCLVSSITGCRSNSIRYINGRAFCIDCESNKISLDGSCDDGADSIEGFYLQKYNDNNDIRLVCPPQCKTCSISNEKIICDSCHSSEYILKDDFCMNIDCQSQLLNVLKPCHPSESTCGMDCNINTDCVGGDSSGVCQRNYISILLSDNELSFKIADEYEQVYELGIHTDSIYDIDGDTSEFFCNYLSDSLINEGSLCKFDSSLKIIKVVMKDQRVNTLRKIMKIHIKKTSQGGALLIKRKNILPSSIIGSYVYDNKDEVNILMEGQTSNNIQLDYYNQVESSKDISVEMYSLNDGLTLKNFGWTILSVKTKSSNSEDQILFNDIQQFFTSSVPQKRLIIPANYTLKDKMFLIEAKATD